MTDRINLDIDGVTFVLAPLNYLQKQDLSSCTRIEKGEEQFDLLKSQALYIKYSLKGIKGLTQYDGNDYVLDFEGDNLTDNCVSEILNLEQREKLSTAAWTLLNGIQEITDHNGKALEGVYLEVIPGGK